MQGLNLRSLLSRSLKWQWGRYAAKAWLLLSLGLLGLADVSSSSTITSPPRVLKSRKRNQAGPHGGRGHRGRIQPVPCVYCTPWGEGGASSTQRIAACHMPLSNHTTVPQDMGGPNSRDTSRPRCPLCLPREDTLRVGY
jgi:hypothetical protein